MNQKIGLMPRVEKGKMTTSLFLMVAQDFDRARTPAVIRHSEPIHATSEIRLNLGDVRVR